MKKNKSLPPTAWHVLFMKHEFPETIVCKNGSVFISDKGKVFVNRTLIWAVNIMLCHPALNGYVYRLVQNTKAVLKQIGPAKCFAV